jgi:hypothetical protein
LRFGEDFEANFGKLEAGSTTWILGSYSAFPLGPRKTTEDLIELAVETIMPWA